ncbi:universal stress protein [Natrinema gelatinilyticum]|uniref:universal stress protein n=1 Tax=Natrinema gelatinilyticum TaxID=2961571 RepID=UPI0020C55DC5|nr:universal stress protein [Natrinema gelatinilyticum]
MQTVDNQSVGSMLVPTDGSDVAGQALEKALAFADRLDANVHVLSVVDTTGNPLKFGVAEVDELNRAGQCLVDEIVDAHDDRDVEIYGAIRRGRPADMILNYATENEIDLILIGRTGRGRVADVLLGSTADRVVRQASIPVIVVPGSEPDE